MQTHIQGDLARVWKHWRWIWVDSHIRTYLYFWLDIWFPHCIFYQAWSTSIVLITLFALILCLYAFTNGNSFINLLVYSVHLFSFNPSFYVFFGVAFQNFQTLFSFYFLILLLIHLDHKKQNKKIKEN